MSFMIDNIWKLFNNYNMGKTLLAPIKQNKNG
jgi:hypothetical protein